MIVTDTDTDMPIGSGTSPSTIHHPITRSIKRINENNEGEITTSSN